MGVINVRLYERLIIRMRFIAEDHGFTSLGVVVALCLVVALLFTSSQVYWLNSTAGDIQFAADAGALAAENVVSEYLIIARVADAVVLSLSLFGLTVYGIAIVVSCIPYAQEVGVRLMDFGKGVLDARDSFSSQAKSSLDTLQKALPFLCVLNAAATIQANTFSPDGSVTYQGIAIPVPLTVGETVYADDVPVEQAGEDIGTQNTQTAPLTDAAQEAQEGMDSSKLEGYLADCGNAPNYCMWERADALATLTPAKNPFYNSLELWTFDAAFTRAKAYYGARLEQERPEGQGIEERVRSEARMRFYRFAVEEMEKGYAHTDEQGVLDAYFPLLPRTSDDVRQTHLYTDKDYPTTDDRVLHGYDGCPAYTAGTPAGAGSLSELEDGRYRVCATCDYSLSTLGRVASASTSIDNGFEYHYRAVAEAAARYAPASREQGELTRKARESAEEALDTFQSALSSLGGERYDPEPPGRFGCIAIALDVSEHQAPRIFTTPLMRVNASLQPRLALSGARLASESPEEGANLISSLLERISRDTEDNAVIGMPLGVFDGILGLWGDTLLTYAQGEDALIAGVGSFLEDIPLVGSTSLSEWARGALTETIEATGLQSVKLDTPKPVLVNTSHILSVDSSPASRALSSAKSAYSSLPGYGSGTFSGSVLEGMLLEIQRQGVTALESEITIATITFGEIPGLPQIPISVSLPGAVVSTGKTELEKALDAVGSYFGIAEDDDIWE